MVIVICPKRFDRPDPDDPSYSLLEVDIYMWIPYDKTKTEGNHRLSIRKNLETGKFELYKAYYGKRPKIVVIFESEDLGEVLKKAHKLWEYHHGKGFREPDEVCCHRPPIIDPLCPISSKKSAWNPPQ